MADNMSRFTNVAEKVMEAGDKKCISPKSGYKYKAKPFHTLGLKYGILKSQGGGFTTYQFGDGSSYRVSSSGTEVLY